MNRQEFIEKLRAALSGRLPSAAVADNVNYYEDYINVEIRKGRAEEEVLASLGDPRLIAKTIIQANSGVGAEAVSPNMGRRSAGYENGYAGGAYDADNSPYVFKIPGWLLTVLTIVAVLFLIGAVFSVLSFLVPLILVMAAVIFIVKLFRDWLN